MVGIHPLNELITELAPIDTLRKRKQQSKFKRGTLRHNDMINKLVGTFFYQFDYNILYV